MFLSKPSPSPSNLATIFSSSGQMAAANHHSSASLVVYGPSTAARYANRHFPIYSTSPSVLISAVAPCDNKSYTPTR